MMGTAGYMSPEQVRGEAATPLGPLRASGAVLYELLTGRRAFHKDTSVGTLNAILTEEPPELPADARIPTPLDRLVRHCLEKKPEDRFQSARDLAYELEGLAGSSAGVAGAVASARHRWPRWLAGAMLGLLALVAAFVAGRQAVVPSPLRYQRLTFGRGAVWSARFAPDGRTIVYGAAWEGQPIRVFTAVPGSPEPRPLDLPDADVLAVSSRGELALALDRYRYTYLGYGRGTLATAPLAGGSPRALLEGVNGADWSPDGRELALAIREGRPSRLEYPQGKVLCRQELPVICPRVSPRADVVAFLERGAVHVVDQGGAKRRLSPLPPRWSNSLAWSPRGDEVWFGGSLRGDEWAIYAVDLQGRTRLVADLPFVGHLLDVGADGRALLTLADERGAMTANAPGAPKEKDLSWLDWSYPLQISRDGRTLLFGEAGQGGSRTQSLYVRPMDGSAPAVRVAEGSNPFDRAALSPDAKWLLVWQPERPAELRLLPSGPGEQTTIRDRGLNSPRPSRSDWKGRRSCSRTAVASWLRGGSREDRGDPGSRTSPVDPPVRLRLRGPSRRRSLPTARWPSAEMARSGSSSIPWREDGLVRCPVPPSPRAFSSGPTMAARSSSRRLTTRGAWLRTSSGETLARAVASCGGRRDLATRRGCRSSGA